METEGTVDPTKKTVVDPTDELLGLLEPVVLVLKTENHRNLLPNHHRH